MAIRLAPPLLFSALLSLAVLGACANESETDSSDAAASSEDDTPRTPFSNLGFEEGKDELGRPSAWEISGAAALDEQVRRSGAASAHINAGLISQCREPGELRGRKVVLSAYLRTAGPDSFGGDLQITSYVRTGVSRTVALTRLEFDGEGRHEAYPERAVRGNVDWTPRQLEVEVHPDSIEVCLSAIGRGGNGSLWVDDMELRVE